MSLTHRTWAYLTRKWPQTVTLLGLMVAIFTLMATCWALHQTTTTVGANIKTALKPSLTVSAKQAPDGLTADMVARLAGFPGMTGAYELDTQSLVRYAGRDGQDLSLKPGEKLDPATLNGAEDLENGWEESGRLYAATNTAQDGSFSRGDLELTSGRMIDGEHQVLIHEDLARRNGLAVGDTITLRSVESDQPSVEARIVGLVTHHKKQSDQTPTMELYENRVFSDAVTGSELIFGQTAGRSLAQSGTFFVTDPDQIDDLMEQVNAVADSQAQPLRVTKDDSDYVNARDALTGMSQIVLIAQVVVVGVCFAVLALFLVFRQQHRLRETGVLLAMGQTKRSILAQRVAEVSLVAVVGWLLAWPISSLIAAGVGQRLLTSNAPSTVIGLADVTVVVTASTWGMVAIIGLPLCVAATIAAMVPTVRLKPKHILSHMS